jgi:predicted amidophosphoribosyltransferase
VVARALSELLAVVVPPACAACRAPLARAQLRLCPDCTRALPWLPAWVCARCGLPRHRRGCPAAGAAFGRAWAPLAYDGVARAIVASLKFRSALPVAGLMAAHIAANLPPELRGPRVLVPVPAQSARRRRRGFDPAGALCTALAPRLELPVSACLVRRDRGRPQVGATRAVRRRRGRMLVELRAPPPAAALLIDDVHTTGATLDACARALRAGGCEEVVAVTYARTL